MTLACWLLLLVGGLTAGRWLSGDLASVVGTWGRMGASITLILLGVLAYFHVPANTRNYAMWIAIGMALGCIGDFFNAGLLKIVPIKDGTVGAIGAFGLGHLLYMAAMIQQLRKAKPHRADVVFGSILFWQIVGLISWYIIVYLGNQKRELIWPALAYTLLLAGTAGIATAVAIRFRNLWPLALGAALFLLSDLLLAVGMFRGSYPYRSEAVWLTYSPGQMLIVLATWWVGQLNATEESPSQSRSHE